MFFSISVMQTSMAKVKRGLRGMSQKGPLRPRLTFATCPNIILYKKGYITTVQYLLKYFFGLCLEVSLRLSLVFITLQFPQL
jgi:hypothetical protein